MFGEVYLIQQQYSWRVHSGAGRSEDREWGPAGGARPVLQAPAGTCAWRMCLAHLRGLWPVACGLCRCRAECLRRPAAHAVVCSRRVQSETSCPSELPVQGYYTATLHRCAACNALPWPPLAQRHAPCVLACGSADVVPMPARLTAALFCPPAPRQLALL